MELLVTDSARTRCPPRVCLSNGPLQRLSNGSLQRSPTALLAPPSGEFLVERLDYKAALRQAPPDGIIFPAEAADLDPSTANCIRSALDAQQALVEAVIAELEELAEKGSPIAATVLVSFQPEVLDRTMSAAINAHSVPPPWWTHSMVSMPPAWYDNRDHKSRGWVPTKGTDAPA